MHSFARTAAVLAALASTPAMAQTANQVWDVYDHKGQLIGTEIGQGLVARLNGTVPTVMEWEPDGFAIRLVVWYTDTGCQSSPYIDNEMPPAMSYWYGQSGEMLGPNSSKVQTLTIQSQYYYDGTEATCYNGFSIQKPVVPAAYLPLKVFYPPFCVVPNGTKPAC